MVRRPNSTNPHGKSLGFDSSQEKYQRWVFCVLPSSMRRSAALRHNNNYRANNNNKIEAIVMPLVMRKASSTSTKHKVLYSLVAVIVILDRVSVSVTREIAALGGVWATEVRACACHSATHHPLYLRQAKLLLLLCKPERERVKGKVQGTLGMGALLSTMGGRFAPKVHRRRDWMENKHPMCIHV